MAKNKYEFAQMVKHLVSWNNLYRWPYIVFALILFIGLTLIIMTYDDQLNNKSNCLEYQLYLNRGIHNTVLDSYIDSNNHLNRVIVLDNYNKLIFYADTSILFHQISEGDSLYKSEYEKKIVIYRKRKNFPIYYIPYFHCEIDNAYY